MWVKKTSIDEDQLASDKSTLNLNLFSKGETKDIMFTVIGSNMACLVLILKILTGTLMKQVTINNVINPLYSGNP